MDHSPSVEPAGTYNATIGPLVGTTVSVRNSTSR